MASKEEGDGTYTYVIDGVVGAVVLGLALILSGMFWSTHILPFLRKRGTAKRRSSLVPRSFSSTKFKEATDALLATRPVDSLTPTSI